LIEVNTSNQPDVYELIWREFKNTLIHELCFRFRTDEPVIWPENCRDYYPDFFGRSAHYYLPDDNRFLDHGFPLPEQGGISLQWGNNSLMRVFMDELFLCPDCWRFHPIRRYGPEITWLDPIKRQIDTVAMFEAIEQRKNVKEFGIRLCEHRDSCEYDAKRHYDKFEMERTAEQKNLERRGLLLATPLEKAHTKLRQMYCVYLVSGNGYVKIGKATNVRRRLSSLQTSSPFPLKLLKTWTCNDAVEKENMLHAKYKKYRHKGEWFLLPDEILTELIAMADLNAF
jgi:hypothetical protein